MDKNPSILWKDLFLCICHVFFSGKDSSTFIRFSDDTKNWTFPFAPIQLVFLLMYKQRGT